MTEGVVTMGMDQEQEDTLRAIYEGMTREELIASSMLAAHAAQDAEDLIDELREQQDIPDGL